MIHAVFDLETVENAQAQHYFTQVKKYFPRSNLKDPAKIEQDILEKRQKDLEQAALHWWSGRIICCCINFLGGDIKPKTFFGDNERALLQQIFDCLLGVALAEGEVNIIGKNGDTFDKPFLIGRAMAHDLGIPHFLRPYRPVGDIDQIFGFSSMGGQRSSLDNYAMGLQIPMKSGHGSKVKEMYLEVQMGDKNAWEKIYRYCAQDVDITTEILKRWLKDYEPNELPKPHVPIVEQLEELSIPF